MKMNNFYFFLNNKITFNSSNNFNLLKDLKKNLIKISFLNKKYKFFNSFFKVINYIYVVKIKTLNENKILLNEKENIFFYIYNNKFYDINYLNIILDNKFLNLNLKIYYYYFFFSYFYNLKKLVFILKLNSFLKNVNFDST